MLDPRPVASAGMGGIQRIFMVGIGGAGMSGISEVLAGVGLTGFGFDPI